MGRICHSRLAGIFAIKPDIDPQKDRKPYGCQQAGGKEPVRSGKVQKGNHESSYVEKGQQYDTDNGSNLFWLFFIGTP